MNHIHTEIAGCPFHIMLAKGLAFPAGFGLDSA
jgi:hypothetical protein